MGHVPTKLRNSKSADSNSLSKITSIHINTDAVIDRSFTVIWCDPSIGSDAHADDATNTLLQLARIVNTKRQLVHIFNEIDSCQDFISQVDNICLIVSGAMGQDLVPLVHDLKQIQTIYIFCMNKPKYEAWAKKYSKIHGVFTNIKEICECLKVYFMSKPSLYNEQLHFDCYNSEQTLSFTYPILCKMILLNLNSMKHNDLILYLRNEFTKEHYLSLINDFEENYSKHEPIWWFTKDNFFRGVINHALQLNDLYGLCKMSTFIKDLDSQLQQLYKQQQPSMTSTLELYFSQSITTDDLNRLMINRGSLILINNFLLTNSEQILALMYIENQSSVPKPNNAVDVLFKISISHSIEPNSVFANIGAVSKFVHDKEYLLSMPSIFRVDSVEKLAEIPSAWSVHLKLVDQNDLQLRHFLNKINNDELKDIQDLPSISANVCNSSYQFKSIIKLLEETLNFRMKQIRSVLLHYNMGIIYNCSGKYNQSLNEYKNGIELLRHSIPNGQDTDRLCLIPFYSNMGLTYQNMKIFKNAFEHTFRTLDIILKDHDNSTYKPEIIASSHYNIGTVLVLQDKISEALTHYQEALRIRQKYLPAGHSDINDVTDIISRLSSKI